MGLDTAGQLDLIGVIHEQDSSYITLHHENTVLWLTTDHSRGYIKQKLTLVIRVQYI
jgi:hypothetical protein